MDGRRAGTWRAWTLGSLGLALAGRLLAGPLPLNYYDIAYALVWGRQILHGHPPDYQTPGASTPHPLGTLLATLAAACGTAGAWYVVQAILFLSLGLAGTALFMLTRACLAGDEGPGGDGAGWRGGAAGALATGALLLSPPFLTDALGASGLTDLPALALVLTAAVLATVSPGRRRAPLVLLGLAGLMRPEAWGLAGAYWLYLAHRRRTVPELIEAAALVLAAPVLWALSDLIVVGNPTYSLTNTQAASHTGMFSHGLGQVPSAALRDLRALVGVPVLAVGSLGALAALAVARRSTGPALGLLAIALGEFAALGLTGVPLLERFLLVVAALLCLFFAWAVILGPGLVGDAGGRERAWPRPAFAVTAALAVAYVGVSHLAGAVHVRRDQRAAVHAEADLLALAGRPEVAAALRRCPTVYVPRFTLTSLSAFDFDLAPPAIRRTTDRPPHRGLVLAPATAAAGLAFGVTAPRLAVLRRLTPPGARPVSQNRSWRLYRSGC